MGIALNILFVYTFCTKITLENVAIANALQLEAARAMPSLSTFNYDAMPSLKLPNLSTDVFAADTILYDVTLTFDLEHL